MVFLVWYLFLDNCEIIKTGFKPGAAILAQRYSAIIRHSIGKIKNTFEIHLRHLYHNLTQYCSDTISNTAPKLFNLDISVPTQKTLQIMHP